MSMLFVLCLILEHQHFSMRWDNVMKVTYLRRGTLRIMNQLTLFSPAQNQAIERAWEIKMKILDEHYGTKSYGVSEKAALRTAR